METKFKVGDKVKRIDGASSQVPIGYIGFITKIYINGCIEIDNIDWLCNKNTLQLISDNKFYFKLKKHT